MAKNINITREQLLELLRYEPETGKLFWRKRSPHLFNVTKQTAEHNAAIWNGRYAGKPACSVAVTGYLETTVLYVKLHAHRIIWMMERGHWPNQIDHINGDRADNRIENLRNVTVAENNKNLSRRVTNTSGVTGVFWVKGHQKWRANIGKTSIGNFQTKEAAIAARKAAEKEFGYHPNHGRG